MPPAFPAQEPPATLAKGSSEEAAWLRTQLTAGARLHTQLVGQLQRLQQESAAIHSSLLAQQHNPLAAADSSPHDDESPEAGGEFNDLSPSSPANGRHGPPKRQMTMMGMASVGVRAVSTCMASYGIILHYVILRHITCHMCIRGCNGM